MSDLDNETSVTFDELSALKQRATQLGLKFHPSIGVDALREKVTAALSDNPVPSANDDAPTIAAAPVVPAVETLAQRRLRMKREALALVRIRVTCMNPAKKEWDGEIFTVGNATIGSVRKFVPFNADDGWHVPNVIYLMMKERQCPTYVASKDARGNTVRKSRMIKEFAIEVLDPLTAEELHDLAQRQAMAKSVD